MRLTHRTNFWGRFIEPSHADADDEVNREAIWVQALCDDEYDCCPGFGRRRVGVEEGDFQQWSDGDWSLYFVSSEWGRTEGHRFWKLALVPDDEHHDWNTGYWEHVATLDPGQFMLDELEYRLRPYWSCGDSRNHVHNAICTAGQDLCAGHGHTDKAIDYSQSELTFECRHCDRQFSECNYINTGSAFSAKLQHERDVHYF
mmetsp:Transcript_27080/g.81182  ORF Transcript_27080/g.81182 Transcript_27080/m.81182 type:complete len:201 (-) Transcript_27080:244-846(-)